MSRFTDMIKPIEEFIEKRETSPAEVTKDLSLKWGISTEEIFAGFALLYAAMMTD